MCVLIASFANGEFWLLRPYIKLYSRKVLSLFMIAMLFSGSAIARNSFLVAPGRVDIDLSRPKTQSFIITNDGDERIRLSIEPVYFAVDSKSLAAGSPIGIHKPGYDDLHKFIRVSPRALSLSPGQRRDIRISVRAPGDLLEGDYRAHLLVKMIENATTLISGETSDEGSVGMRLNIKMETGVALYGHKGDREPKIDFICNTDPKGHLQIQANNTSVWLFDGWIRIYEKGAVSDDSLLYEYRLRSIRESSALKITPLRSEGIAELEIQWQDNGDSKPLHKSSCIVSS